MAAVGALMLVVRRVGGVGVWVVSGVRLYADQRGADVTGALLSSR
jgi:hypothetical protein